MKISLVNLQRECRIHTAAVRELTAWLMDKAGKMNPGRVWRDCSVVVVGHRRMIRLNQECLGHEGTTDVITFAYPTQPGESPPGWRAEIVINVDQAIEASKRTGADVQREFALYLAHGCQHLGGADDRTANERAAMNRRQNRWLREAGRAGLLRKLVGIGGG